MLFEVRCPGCGRSGWCPCQDCIDSAAAIPPLAATSADYHGGHHGGHPGAGFTTDLVGLTTSRVSAVAGAASTASLFWHEGVAREFVRSLKFQRERSIGRWLGDALAANAPPDISLVTWPPTTKARRRQRGFDQAEVLARRVARRLGVPARRLLIRTNATSQSGLGRAQRLVGPTFVSLIGASQPAFGANQPANFSSVLLGSILIVDDVLTTGATMRAAVAAIQSSGKSSGNASGDQLPPNQLPPNQLAPDQLAPDQLPPNQLPPDQLTPIVHVATCTRAR